MKSLSYKQLKKKLNIGHLKKNKVSARKAPHVVGQKRALAAMHFGLRVPFDGYNLFVMGPPGIGKRALLSNALAIDAKKRNTPNDWCYLYNFEFPERPLAVSFPAGYGYLFQQDMKYLVDQITDSITIMLKSLSYRRQIKKIHHAHDKKENNFMDYAKHKTDKIHLLYKAKNKQEKMLQTRLLKSIIVPVISKLKKKYSKFKTIQKFLTNVQIDMLQHINNFIQYDVKMNIYNFSLENVSLTKYKVNLFIDNKHSKGAPIIYEGNPTYSNLICRIEHISDQDHLSTNFTLIRAGSLLRANGGYLVMDARKITGNQKLWEALKIALFSHEVHIEDIENHTKASKSVSFDPGPILLKLKVCLIGDRQCYYDLCQDDNGFVKLFKSVVDFDDEVERNAYNIKNYIKLIHAIILEKKLLPFQNKAIIEMINYSSRLAEDNERLSTYISLIKDLMIEANYWAKMSSHHMVKDRDVKKALHEQAYRMSRARLLYLSDIHRGFIIIKTDGHTIGEVNCLSVRKVGKFSYGHPTRVSARTKLHFGKSRFIDIQREIKLAGAIHSKAGLIISNILTSHYNFHPKLSISASISFEQIYIWTDGDSASIGELCALLSSLAMVPINQSFAITGSIDQYGHLQAVGGINEKIEGFFEVCMTKGMTNKQGVIIPAINVKNLILNDRVLMAIKKNQFAIYPIETVDEAILLLTGLKIGKRNNQGKFPKNTLNYFIETNFSNFLSHNITIE